MILGPLVIRYLTRVDYQADNMNDDSTSSDIFMAEECGYNTNSESCASEQSTAFAANDESDSVQSDSPAVCINGVCENEEEFQFNLRQAVIAQTILQNDYIEELKNNNN